MRIVKYVALTFQSNQTNMPNFQNCQRQMGRLQTHCNTFSLFEMKNSRLAYQSLKSLNVMENFTGLQRVFAMKA
jgi:hypothetical protein